MELTCVAVYLAALIIPTVILSIQPHQEPRFLVPLIIPLILILQDASFFKGRTLGTRRHRRHFWVRSTALGTQWLRVNQRVVLQSGWIGHTLLFTDRKSVV